MLLRRKPQDWRWLKVTCMLHSVLKNDIFLINATWEPEKITKQSRPLEGIFHSSLPSVWTSRRLLVILNSYSEKYACTPCVTDPGESGSLAPGLWPSLSTWATTKDWMVEQQLQTECRPFCHSTLQFFQLFPNKQQNKIKRGPFFFKKTKWTKTFPACKTIPESTVGGWGCRQEKGTGALLSYL